MHIRPIGTAAVLATALALAGCGEDQTAQNQAPPAAPAQPAPQIAQPASPPATPLQAPGGQPQQPTASTPPLAAPGAASDAATPSAPATTGSVNRSGAAGGDAGSAFRAIVGREFTGGPVTLRLDQGERFTMRDPQGSTVSGRYAFANGVLTLSDPEGDVRGAQFPMRCRFAPEADGRFRLEASEGSCPYFRDVVFNAAG